MMITAKSQTVKFLPVTSPYDKIYKMMKGDEETLSAPIKILCS